MIRAALCCLLFAAAGCATSPGVQPLRATSCPGDVPVTTIDGPAGASLQILAVGDTGEGPDERGSHLAKTIAAMQAIAGADAMLLLGDNVYRCGVRDTAAPEWERVIAPLFAVGVPIYPVLGNHDWGNKEQYGCRFSNPEAQVQKSGAPGFELWRFPAPTYIVQTEIAELVMFDSSPMAYGWPDEIAAALCPLRAALAAPKTKPWRIVVGHHPLYSCGDHGDQASTTNMREAVQDLLVKSDVDLYVAGHDHDLEFATAPVASPLFLVSGSGSKIRRRGARCKEGENFQIKGGFALLDITADELNIRVHCNGEASPCMSRRLAR